MFQIFLIFKNLKFKILKKLITFLKITRIRIFRVYLILHLICYIMTVFHEKKNRVYLIIHLICYLMTIFHEKKTN